MKLKQQQPYVRRLSGLAAVFTLALAACGPVRPRPAMQTQSEQSRRPVAVNGENVTDLLRELDEGPLGANTSATREGVVRYLATQGLERLGHGDSEGALRSLRLALSHYNPEELGRGGLPSELTPLARGLLEVVSQRGQEAGALAMNRVLEAVAPPDPQAAARFTQVHDWGDHNRAQFQSAWTYRREMAQIYGEVARTVAAPDVLRRALEYNVARRRAAQEARTGMGRGRMSMEDVEALEVNLRRSSMDAALLYLRLGDLRGAIDAASQVGGSGPNTVAEVLRSVADDPDPANKMAELAQQLERVDGASMAGVCRHGRREFPRDPRFAQCLGAAAAGEGNWGLASAHLERAASLAPTNPTMLTRAMEVTRAWFEAAHTDEDPLPARRALERLRALQTRWTEGNPRTPSPLTASELERMEAELFLARAELRPAREHLERAVAAQPPSRDAFLVLAEIAWRERDVPTATRWLAQGAALPLGPSESDSTFRPLFALQRGQLAMLANDAPTAQRELLTASQGYEALARSLSGPQRANALVQQATALQFLGGHDAEARRSLDEAVELLPDSRELAGVAVTMNLAFARWGEALELVQQARRRLTLDRSWQTYFALWQRYASGLAGQGIDEDAQRTLQRIVDRAPEMVPWTTRLAQRALGQLTREQLLSYALLPGQRAEAAFYEALGEMAQDPAAAQRDLQATVATNMLRYLEYGMAWELLRTGPSHWQSARVANPVVASAPVAAPAVAPAPAPAAPVRPAPHRPGTR